MSSLTLDVEASCSMRAVELRTSMYGTVWAPHSSPTSSESHWVKLVALSAEGMICTSPRYVLLPFPAEIPLATMVLLVFFPTWIIFVPVSACWWLLTRATE